MTQIAHRLNKRIRLQQIFETPNATAGFTRTYVDVGSVWAEVKPLKGREYINGVQVLEKATHKITIRFNKLAIKDIFINLTQNPKEPDRLLRILSQLNPNEKNEYLELMAEEIEEESAT